VLLVLARTVGDLSEGEIEALVQERTFDVSKCIVDGEEEVARRVLDIHQELEERCLQKEDEGRGREDK
jgi:hypothetical protein